MRDPNGVLIDTGDALGDFAFSRSIETIRRCSKAKPKFRGVALLLPGEFFEASDCGRLTSPERLHDAIEDEIDAWREAIEDVD